MSRRSEQRSSITQILCGYVLENGLSETSVRQLAKAAGVSDRMLLYYFEDKFDVLATVMQTIASTFTDFLNQALPNKGPQTLAQIFEEVATLNSAPDVQPFMSLWIETIASASRGAEPYKSAAMQIGAGFLNWIETRLPPGEDAPAKAAMVLTMIEGLAVMNACADETTQQNAAALIHKLLEASG